MIQGTTESAVSGDGFHTTPAGETARLLREVIRSRLGLAVAAEGDVALDVDGTIVVFEDDRLRSANDG